MATATAEQAAPRKRFRLSRWDSPWMNPKFLIGIFILVLVFVVECHRPHGLGHDAGPCRLLPDEPAAHMGDGRSGAGHQCADRAITPWAPRATAATCWR